MMNNSFIDYGYISFNKYSEELCGDTVSINDDGNKITIVLADGMGSGVKANILSTLTANILNTMLTNNIDIEESVETLIDTLPVNSDNGVAYCTFSIASIDYDGKGVLYEFDNPKYIYMRDSEIQPLNEQEFEVCGKRITKAILDLKDDDYIVLMSDGVPYAGSGTTLNYGFSRDSIIQYLKQNINNDMSSKQIAAILAKACDDLYMQKPYDDTSVVVIKKRKRSSVSIMIGPPKDSIDDEEYVRSFLENKDYRIVCGGTTSKVVNKYLNESIIMSSGDGSMPPQGYSDSIQIISEGLLTLKRVNDLADLYLNNYLEYEKEKNDDAASKISEALFEKASDINVYVGHGINLNHVNVVQDDKFVLVSELIDYLKMMNKNISRHDY